MQKEQFIGYLHNSEKLDQNSLSALKTLTSEQPWFQAGWILYLKNLKNIGSPDFESELKKVAILVPDRKQLHRFLNNEISFTETLPLDRQQSSYKLEDSADETLGGNSLIERFLSTNPGGFKRKAEPDERTDNKLIIDKSVEEDNDLVSETLANIYFKQKNYEKACDAYQKLSLKYPEKSIYFAARIKEIEVIKNNT